MFILGSQVGKRKIWDITNQVLTSTLVRLWLLILDAAKILQTLSLNQCPACLISSFHYLNMIQSCKYKPTRHNELSDINASERIFLRGELHYFVWLPTCVHGWAARQKKEKQPSPAVVCRMDDHVIPLKNEAVSQTNCNVCLPDRKTLSELDDKQINNAPTILVSFWREEKTAKSTNVYLA